MAAADKGGGPVAPSTIATAAAAKTDRYRGQLFGKCFNGVVGFLVITDALQHVSNFLSFGVGAGHAPLLDLLE